MDGRLHHSTRQPANRHTTPAIQMGMDRDEPVTTHQSIDVTHRHIDPVAEEIAELRALRELGTSREKLIELFGGNGLARLESLEAEDAARNAKVIQGKVIEEQDNGPP